MSGLLLRLAGPMQSWGDHSTFSVRDTRPYPTRSGLIGLFAGVLGRHRGEPIDDLADLAITIRVDRPGTLMQDFHTVGGGLPREQTTPTAEGGRRLPGTGTIVSRRNYLADAVFTVAVTGPQPVTEQVAQALDNPAWAPYLGRRSCPAETPLLLRSAVDDPVADLHQLVPLARRKPSSDDSVPVDFILESPPSGQDNTSRLAVNDLPIDFHPHRRHYRSRSIWVTSQPLPARLFVDPGIDYLRALKKYLEGVPA
ncbi:type I-E CRISPR-associated protein Cas5/CasD [Rhizomonospora bruguierae]|uniref:type I-E CRISPR-associated protein Cas5/CasD n=1 Tax=Rhizomonospora bruguierae TaxID=1581705 RepID=UPI001BD12460|nr:type I-E CRISPR-associated protein Cas5/CasD [Micromonospora sp. NBRC 107566]